MSSTQQNAGEFDFLVEDMSCGHCAASIAKAIEQALPGTVATADPATKRVRVSGSADYPAIRAAVSAARYTPAATPGA